MCVYVYTRTHICSGRVCGLHACIPTCILPMICGPVVFFLLGTRVEHFCLSVCLLRVCACVATSHLHTNLLSYLFICLGFTFHIIYRCKGGEGDLLLPRAIYLHGICFLCVLWMFSMCHLMCMYYILSLSF